MKSKRTTHLFFYFNLIACKLSKSSISCIIVLTQIQHSRKCGLQVIATLLRDEGCFKFVSADMQVQGHVPFLLLRLLSRNHQCIGVLALTNWHIPLNHAGLDSWSTGLIHKSSQLGLLNNSFRITPDLIFSIVQLSKRLYCPCK